MLIISRLCDNEAQREWLKANVNLSKTSIQGMFRQKAIDAMLLQVFIAFSLNAA